MTSPRVLTQARNFSLLILSALAIPTAAYARPEYAVKQVMSCVACHYAPWGGGPKTVYGKIFGSRGMGMGKFTTNDTFAGSIRTIGYYPTNSTTQKSNGFALMEASLSFTGAVLENKDANTELRAIVTYNMAPLGTGLREAYGRYQTGSESIFPSYFSVGQIYVPFGLLSDEHRTYTMLQTNMTLNNYDVGAVASGNFAPTVTYDLALVNNFYSAGAFSQGDLTYGEVYNMRWIPASLPVLLGASQNFERTMNFPQPYAFSGYMALSLDRLTNSTLHGSFLYESVFAKNWGNATLNPSIPQFFIPASDAAYQASVATTRSWGQYAQFKYDLSNQWVLVYKFDYLNLATSYPSDAFFRNGLGFEYFAGPNVIIDARGEIGKALRSEITPATTSLAAQDDVLLMLRLWM